MTSTADTPGAEGTLRASLWVVVSGFLLQAVLPGAGVDTVAIFVKAIATTEGWSSSTVSVKAGSGEPAAAPAPPPRAPPSTWPPSPT